VGSCRAPGRYEISTSINLINLLSLAGGPQEDARIDNIRITRIVEDKPAIRRKVFTVNLEDIIEVKESDLTLSLANHLCGAQNLVRLEDGIGYVLPVLSLTLSVVQLYIILTR